MKLINPKLVTVTRKDLTEGQRSVQSAHAAINFCFEHNNKASPWFLESNYLIQLEVETEQDLVKLIERCNNNFLDITVFIEPDLKHSITAIAIEPSLITQKLVSNIPLLFKTKKDESI